MKEATIKALVLSRDFEEMEAAGLRVVRVFPTTDTWRIIYQKSVVGHFTEYWYSGKGEYSPEYFPPDVRRTRREALRASRRAQHVEYLRARAEVLDLLARGVPLGYTPGQSDGTLWAKRPGSIPVAARRVFMRLTGNLMNTPEDWEVFERFVVEATNPLPAQPLGRRRTAQWVRDYEAA